MPRRSDPELLLALGARMARLRAARGMTQEEVAERAGLEPMTLSRCENGSRTLSITNLARVAAALDIGLGELLDVERPDPEPSDNPAALAWTRMWERMSADQQDVASRMMREFLR